MSGSCFKCTHPERMGQQICEGSCGLCNNCPGKHNEQEKPRVGDSLRAWLEETREA